MNPVLASIYEHLALIEVVYKPTNFKKDRQGTGDSKEISVKTFLTSYLNKDYAIEKGHIYSLYGESNSIDCVVLMPTHPPLNTGSRKVMIAEGVYCAIEVKPDISSVGSKSEFRRALLQIQTVKRLKRDINLFTHVGTSFYGEEKNYLSKIPSVIFSWKSPPVEKLVSLFKTVCANGELEKEDLPDMIITMDKGVYFYSPFIKESIVKNIFDCSRLTDSQLFHISGDKSKTLSWFLYFLLTLPPNNNRYPGHFLTNYFKDITANDSANLYEIS